MLAKAFPPTGASRAWTSALSALSTCVPCAQSCVPALGRKQAHPSARGSLERLARAGPSGLHPFPSIRPGSGLCPRSALTCSPRHTSSASLCGSCAHSGPGSGTRLGCHRGCRPCATPPRSVPAVSTYPRTWMPGPSTLSGALWGSRSKGGLLQAPRARGRREPGGPR